MIWFDGTQRSVLVGCRRCGSRQLAGSRAAADAWAHAHVMACAPDDQRAVWASQKRRQRDTP